MLNNNSNFYNNYKCIKDESNLIISFCVECNEPLSLKSITSNAHRGHTFQDIEYIMKSEQLFWKVFNNKLIRDNIFSMIEQTPLHKKQIHYLKTKISPQNNPYYFNRIKFKYIRSLGFMVKRKLWSLLEIKLKADEYILIKAKDLHLFLKINRDINLISLLYEKKKDQLNMFDLVECAYTLDNQVALEYFLSMNVPTYLSNYLLFNNGNNNNGFSISSFKSLELLLKYKVNLIESNINLNNNRNSNFNNSNSNNSNNSNNGYVFGSNNNSNVFSPIIFGGLINSNSNNNLISLANNNNNNDNNNNNNNNSLTRSASCSSLSSSSSNDSNNNSYSYNSNNYSLPQPKSYRYIIKEKVKNSTNNLLPHLCLLNIGNIQEALDQFKVVDYSKISYEIIKKCLKYSNIKDLERLFSEISKNAPGIPFDRFSQSVLCGRKDVYALIVRIYPEFFNQLSFNQSIRQTIIRGDLDMLSFLFETYRDLDYSKDLKNELIELSINNNNQLILNYILKNFK